MEEDLEILISALRYYSNPKIFRWDAIGKSLIEPEILYDQGKKAIEALTMFQRRNHVPAAQ
jgi:hypothetical protein